MAGLLKSFGKGLLYLLVLPILIVILAVYLVIGIVIFVFIGIKGIILYFSGRNIFGELPEDIKAREILEGKTNQEEAKPNDNPVITPTSFSTYYTPTDNTYKADEVKDEPAETKVDELEKPEFGEEDK